MANLPHLGIREARAQLGTLVDEAYFRGRATVITKNDQPRAVLIPYNRFLEMTNAAAPDGNDSTT